MSEIILCNQPISVDLLQDHCGIRGNDLMGLGCSKPSRINAYTPYLVMQNSSTIGQGVLNQLAPMPISRELTHLSLSFGGNNVVAFAEVTAKLQEYNLGLMGASTSVYANRIGGFAGAVANYQSTLMEYRQAIIANPAMKTLAKRKAHAAFQKMQMGFRNELAVVTAQSHARRGLPLTSVTRAINIAKSSRHVAKLNVASQVQANHLVKLSQHAKFLGNGLVAIDFGNRVGKIHNSYQAGGNWERDLFIESSSFALSAGSGILAVNAGSAALAFLMVATPMGWVGLIVGGVAVAGVAAATSIGFNNYTKKMSGGVYDNIMKWIGVQ